MITVAFAARCAALRHRGLSRDLTHQLQDANDEALLVDLEAASDEFLAAMSAFDEQRQAAAERVVEQATHVVWWRPSSGEVVAVAELGPSQPVPAPWLAFTVPLPCPLLWQDDGDQA